MKIALVAFRGTIAAAIALHCQGFDTYQVGSSEKQITALCPTLSAYDFIVAMGVTTKRPRGFVRVERACTGGPLDVSLAEGELFQVSRSIGDSWCNMLATRVLGQHKTVAFLHVPSGIDILATAQALQTKLGKY